MDIIDIQSAIDEVKQGQAVLLDVRRDDEWDSGHAEAAIHFDSARIDAGEMPNLDKNQRIYVHCKSGGRAGRAMLAMQSQGFTDVRNLGGLNDWLSAGGK